MRFSFGKATAVWVKPHLAHGKILHLGEAILRPRRNNLALGEATFARDEIFRITCEQRHKRQPHREPQPTMLYQNRQVVLSNFGSAARQFCQACLVKRRVPSLETVHVGTAAAVRYRTESLSQKAVKEGMIYRVICNFEDEAGCGRRGTGAAIAKLGIACRAIWPIGNGGEGLGLLENGVGMHPA